MVLSISWVVLSDKIINVLVLDVSVLSTLEVAIRELAWTA